MTENNGFAVQATPTDPYVQAWHMWHEQRLEELTAPHGYLAPASITWIANGETATVPDVPGVWSAANDTLVYTPDRGTDDIPAPDVSNAGETLYGPVSFTPTAFGEQALGYLRCGDLRVEVNSQTDLRDQDTHRFWIRVKDPNTERRRDFTGIDTYPVNRSWRFPATFRRAEGDELDIHDSVVKTVLQSYPVLGFVEFDHAGEHHSLVVSNVFGHAAVFFSDETTGKETYGIGRVLNLDPLTLDALDTIDFNYAINYPCAFSPFCTCPIPSRRNHLPFAVTAGEKTPREAAQY